ncbi:MAG: signal peptidase II, partial [Oscillospiraceae bacterium]|nr:signal peptidase II [Oscillospiraceae bacterium]
LGTFAAAYLLVKYGRRRPVLFWCLTAIIGGGIGNMIDRIFRGGLVVDYLDVQLFEFAVFNFADCFVTVGTIVLMIYILFFMDKHEKRLKAQENAHDKA